MYFWSPVHHFRGHQGYIKVGIPDSSLISSWFTLVKFGSYSWSPPSLDQVYHSGSRDANNRLNEQAIIVIISIKPNAFKPGNIYYIIQTENTEIMCKNINIYTM